MLSAPDEMSKKVIGFLKVLGVNYINDKNYGTDMNEFNFIIEQGEDGYLISEVVELPGCHTQAKSFDELVKRTREAISLYLKVQKDFEVNEKFLGVQRIEV